MIKSKYLKLVGFNHCEIQIEDFIILLQSQSIQELSLRRNPELFSRMSCGLNPALHFGFYESFIKENFLNPLGNNLTQSLKILDLRGTEFDDECRKGVLMNANFRKNVYEPFRIILCSIGSLEKVIVSKVYCDDGDGKKAIIPFKSLIGFQNTNQNLNNQTITTNSSTSNGGSKNFSGTSKKSENI
jgi:hypothetical protein